MVIVDIRALELEYLVKLLDCGRSRSRYIFTDSDSAALESDHPDVSVWKGCCCCELTSLVKMYYNGKQARGRDPLA
jgi:hypothetical protein